MRDGISIGKASEVSGVKVTTIRYCEQVEMLAAPERTEANRRTYGERDLDRLTFIRHSRELGFDLDAIRTLLSLQDAPAQSCAAADAIAKARLADVEQRIASLTALRIELERMVEGCSHGRVEDYRVIEILADHGKCNFHDHQPVVAVSKIDG